LFSPDLFSNSIAKYDLALDGESQTVKNILQNYYKFINLSNFKILKLKGLEINSNNFCLKGQDKSYILKKLNKTEDLELINKQLQLTNWLSTQNIPIPKVILPDNSLNQLINHNDNNYYLMEFIDGFYYEGFQNSLTNSIEVILDLFNALESAPKIFKINQNKVDYCFSSFTKIIVEVESVKSEWKEIFGSGYDILNSSWQKIRTTFDLLSQREGEFNSSPYGLCHIDLHPHNILMRKDKILGILDFSSLLNSSINSSISFGFFKLARQATVYEKNNTNIDAIFPKLNEAYKLFTIKGYLDEPKDFLFYSQVEIIRRLLLIIELNIHQNNKEWNNILPVQISALYESEFLFNHIVKGEGVR
jgi:hypothetical protein